MLNLFKSLTTLQKSLVVSILSIILFFASAGVSYSFFSKGGVTSSSDQVSTIPQATVNGDEDPNQPKTEMCPLNGVMRTKAAKEKWDLRRPLGVMIENHLDARPQSGLSSADVVYETIAEGGITRFLAVFLCTMPDIQVGPVRSARTYFLDWISEYDGLYAHVGGANCDKNTGSGCANGAKADALGQIIKYQIKSLNQFSIGFPTYWRDYQRFGERSVATEHTMYSTTHKLWDIAAKKGWTNVDETGVKWDVGFTPWKFKDDQPSGTPVAKMAVNFWNNSDYKVTWQYDNTCNCYMRFQNDATPHLDLDNNKQLTVKTVIVQFEKESSANDGYDNNAHMLYGTIGKGKALIMQDGVVTEGQWVKDSRIARSKFLDSKGKEILFNRGLIWIQTVSTDSNVSY